MLHKFKVQIAPKGDPLPPDRWTEIEAINMIDAAVRYLTLLNVKGGAFPLTVYVSDGKHLHPNGSPMDVHGFTFTVEEKAHD